MTLPDMGMEAFAERARRAVEWHLSKVVGKLGISSRKELRAALSDVGAAVHL